MNRWTKRCMAFVLTLTIICTSISAVKPTVETTYAATVQNITKSTKVVCRKTVAVKAPSGYKNCKYSSTNPKVASIDAKGKLKSSSSGRYNPPRFLIKSYITFLFRNNRDRIAFLFRTAFYCDGCNAQTKSF